MLSFLFPGLGQAYNRQWALAAMLAVPALLVIGLAALAFALGGRGVLSRLLDSRVLIALIVLDLALLGWRLVAILQAHTDRARLSLRSWPTWVTGVLVVVTLAMHAFPAYYAGKAIDTLGAISFEGGGQAFDGQQGGGLDYPVPTYQPRVDAGERVTILLVGVDFAPGRQHHLTDTMLVATFDPATRAGAMVSIPRDLYGVPLGDGRVYDAKLNSLMARAGADSATYPLGGPGTLKAAIGELLGTSIHYFAAIDMEGFKQLIDSIGGVDVVLESPLNEPSLRNPRTGERGIYLEAGPHQLDGETALIYVRARKGPGESDFTRAERQQILVAAIARQLSAGNLLLTLPSLLDVVRDNVATDIPADRIPEIALAGQDVDFNSLERVVLAPPDYVVPEPASAAGYILHPQFDAIRELGRRVFQ